MGCVSDGTTMTVFPTASAGATKETKPSNWNSSGAAMPRTPTGSFIASVTPRIGVWCPPPSHLSAQRAERTTAAPPHSLAPALAPTPRTRVTTEARCRVEQFGRLDPHDAGFELRRDIEGEIDVLRPHAGGESVGGVVRELHRLFRCAERHAHQHRAEDFDLRNRGGRRDIGEKRRRIEVAFGRACPGRLPHLGAFLHPLLHEPPDPLDLHRPDDRAHVDGLIEPRADAPV